MIVVMAVIGLLVSVSLPSLTGYARQARLKAAARETIGLLSLARSMAISAREPRTVLIDPGEGQISIEASANEDQTHLVKLGPGIEVTVEIQGQGGQAEGAAELTFQPSGALAGRSVTVTLSNGDHSQTITVTATTGSILVGSRKGLDECRLPC